MQTEALLNKFKCKRKLIRLILIKTVTYAFALFGLLSIVLLFALVGMLSSPVKTTGIPASAILQIDLDMPFTEVRRDNLLAEVGGGEMVSFTDLMTSIELARSDNKIKAIAVKINNSELGMAQIQELRQMIEHFKTSGKKAYLYSSGFGDLGGGTAEYYLASVFDEITMLPNADIGITGMGIEIPFFRTVLDKVGITPEFYARHEYKTAMASFTDKTASEVLKKELKGLVDTINNQVIQGILFSRFEKENKIAEQYLFNPSPISSKEGNKLGLIDNIGYENEWQTSLESKYKAKFVSIKNYAEAWNFHESENMIAFVVLEGAIASGSSMDSPVSGEAVIGSDTVLAQIKEISENDKVKAVVVRINSPGGSYVASVEIWHALEQLKKDKKIPLIVSMGNYAASGGYLVALSGDKILADDATITGSIGVLGGKFVLQDMWKKLGVNWESIMTSETAGIMSLNQPFNAKQKAAFNRSLDRVYADFVKKVSASRKIDINQIDRLARGRVWLGSEALENGLIDQIGGFCQAINLAKNMAGIGDNDNFSIVFYPKKKTLQEKIAELTGGLQVSTAKHLKSEIGLDISSLYMLKRLQYDAVLFPFVIN